MISERSNRLLLMGIVGVGIFFNNILRWFPFPAGRSQNDVTGLENNLLGIVVNTFCYAAVLLLLLFNRRHGRISLHSGLIVGFVAYVLLQTVFRASSSIELIRSIALTIMFVSADQLGGWLTGKTHRLLQCMRILWLCLITTIWIGIVIGLVLRDSVNWGSGLSPSFSNQTRAEFFFFHILPYPTVALSIWILMDKTNQKANRWLAGVSIVTICVLAVLTMTRSIVFSNILVIAIFLFKHSRKVIVVAALGLIVGALALPDLVNEASRQLRVDSIFTDNPGVDFTNSRSASYVINFDSFAESPFFGLGGEQARQRILEGDTLAKSEYGYTIHLAAYGLFSVLFFAYVLWGFYESVRGVLHSRHRLSSSNPEVNSMEGLALAIASVTIASGILGFVWIFGSGTAFFDWLPLMFVGLSVKLWKLRRNKFTDRAVQSLVATNRANEQESAMLNSST